MKERHRAFARDGEPRANFACDGVATGPPRAVVVDRRDVMRKHGEQFTAARQARYDAGANHATLEHCLRR
jgi:hypothetical protein